ncbi:MAG TPA: hypothetical protein VK927_07755, partial [Adhaeribacter sp.]|nr:hypothetical protein [Adhaeribacter sp.]
MKKPYLILICTVLLSCNTKKEAKSGVTVTEPVVEVTARSEAELLQYQLFSLYLPVQDFPLAVSTVPGSNNPNGDGFEY